MPDTHAVTNQVPPLEEHNPASSPVLVEALIREGVVAKEPTSKKDLAAVQAAFNTWREQSKRPVREISRILALSVG